MESARPATTDDRAVLAELAVQARAEMVTKRGGEVLDRLDVDRDAPAGSIERLWASEGGVLVVGCVEGTQVGFGAMQVEVAADGQPHAVVEQIYVDPGARGVGVGQAMVELLLAEATARRAVGIEALALPGDRATKNFFESQGMVARAIVVHRLLEH